MTLEFFRDGKPLANARERRVARPGGRRPHPLRRHVPDQRFTPGTYEVRVALGARKGAARSARASPIVP